MEHRYHIKKIKEQQRKILEEAIAALHKEYQDYCTRFISKLAPDTRENCREAIEEQLKWEWETHYDAKDKNLQLALIHFERYEREYHYLDI